ncbi:Disease resistance protein [Corchorus olitorius]|uniref:Disease resistance protein n=1 Tax=Corchorus olitorius TaxID=93759 RepID=A0A1R3IZ35_9ROSI|nr:Disease resistance protein [Corchorus olitorius]
MEACICSIVKPVADSVLGKVAEYTVDPIARQVGYIFKYKSNFQNLREQLQQLKDARERVQQAVNEANRKGEEVFDDVSRWLTEANGSISEDAVMKLNDDEETAIKRCFIGVCPNFKSRYQLSKKADKEANSIVQLLEKAKQFGTYSFRPAPEGIATRPVKDYEAFESRKVALDGIMEALKDANLSMVGVYGMGGVGKTTLVKQVAVQAKEENMFDEVVMAVITQSFDMKKMQDELAYALGLKLDEPSDSGRAGQLRNRLKKEKKVLVILDDIWVRLNLEAIGIPSKAEHQGCKILMTSRELNVLSLMGSEKSIAVDTLKEEEAWMLFKQKAGNVVDNSEVLPVAIEVAKRCAGLPVAIATIGTALKDKNLVHWRKTLREFRRPSVSNFKGIPGDVYKTIELSYKFLETEELRSTFLLCSIMGHNSAIEDLLRYRKGLGLINGVDTIGEARDGVLTLIDDLKACCLLLDSSTPGCFDIHDVVRDVAISIASRDNNWLVLGREYVYEEWSNDETMQICNLISLRHAKVLPPNVLSRLSRLEELYLYNSFDSWEVEGGDSPQGNASLVELQYLPHLTILEVHISTEQALPKDTNFFGKLERFKISIGWQMWGLFAGDQVETSRMLLLADESIHLYDDGLLRKVESLYMRNVEKDVLNMVYDVNVECLQHLKHFSIDNMSGIDCIFNSKKLATFPPLKSLALDSLEDLKTIYYGDDQLTVGFFGELRVIQVRNCDMLKNLFSFSIARELRQLEEVEVSDCQNITELIVKKREEEKEENLEFSQLHSLKLNELPSLICLCCPENSSEQGRVESIEAESNSKLLFDQQLVFSAIKELELRSITVGKLWHDIGVPKMSFSCLTSLSVQYCHKLKYLFSSSMAKSFEQLKSLVVCNCEEMEEVIVDLGTAALVEEERNNTMVLFPNLYYLEMKELPKLKRFFSGNQVALPMLENLYINSMENLERLWPNLANEESFPELVEVSLENCQKLLNIFPLSMSRRLQKLNRLSIKDCKLVEEIFEPQTPLSHEGPPSSMEQGENIIAFEFPQLTILELFTLPSLKSFYHKMHTINFPSMKKELQVQGCDKVEILFASNFPETGQMNQQEIPIQLPLFCLNKLSLTNLEELSLMWNVGMKEIWHAYGHGHPQQLASEYFPKLKTVEISFFDDECLDIFPSYLFQFLMSLPHLESLVIEKSSFKEIFQIEGVWIDDEKPLPPLALQLSWLTNLRLSNLYKLRHLWKEKEGFPNLRILVISDYRKLEDNLFPSSVSFHNLVCLMVDGCHEIKYLITHWTAKSLVQLQEMIIFHCNSMEEVIQGNDGDDEDGALMNEEIYFPQLKLLKLLYLPIESFCSSGNFTFHFPSLENVVVDQCPNMKMFSKGDSYTPMLHKVATGDYYDESGNQPERWDGGLNSTIQEMFKENKEQMEICDDSEFKDEQGNSEIEDEEIINDINLN